MSRLPAIAYLTSIYPRATDTFVRNEVLRLRESGHEVRTFAIRRADPAQLVSDQVRDEQVRTTYIVSDNLLRTPLALLARLVRAPGRFWRALRLALATRPPGLRGLVWQLAYLLEAAFLAERMLRDDIGHLHNHIGENSASVAMLASELAGIPYSLTIHGPYIFRAPERWALGEKIVRSAFTVCISEFTRSQCMVFAPYTEWDRLHVVRCAPDPAFLEAEPPPPTGAARLVWIGRICEEKAVPLLVQAAQQLAEAGLDFELVMIGDGPLRPAMEAEIAARGLGPRVSIRGWLDSDAVRKEIVASRALVMPSFAEGLPVVLMEALALARPVVSTAIAGTPELVEPGVTGWLVPAGSLEGLTQAMREALELPPERLRQMGEAGRAAVRRLHDPRQEVAKLAQLFERSLARNAEPAP